MSLFSLVTLTISIIMVILSSTEEFVPHTQSNWSTFTCFDENDLSELFDEEYLSKIFQMGEGIELLFDDEGLASLSAAIIMREIMGYNVTIASYSNFNPIEIITNSSYIASALEIYPNYLNPDDIYRYSVQNPLFIDQPLGVQSLTSWYITNTFIDYIHSNTNHDDELWPDFWRTYTLKHISDELFSVNDMQDLNVTATVNNNDCTSCNVLLVSDTTYDLSLNAQIISDYNLSSLSIQYLDAEQRTAFIERDEFVLFSFRSPSTIVNSEHFERISLPSHANAISMINIHKFIPNALQIISRFGFDFVSSLKMSNVDYNNIYKSIYADIGIDSVLMENADHRLNGVCNWLKTSAMQWTAWLPDLTPYESINCGLYSDEELSNLRYVTDYHADKLPFTDIWTAQRVNAQCISSASAYPESLVAVQIVSCTLSFAIFVCVILVFLCRQQVIIIAASYPLLLSFLCGAIIGCSVPIFGSPQPMMYICEILCVHTSIILMFGSLIGKSWRLQLIIANAQKGKKTRITTRYIMLRILAIWMIMCIYWCVVMLQCAEIDTIYNIVYGVEYLQIKMENDKLFTLIALVFEFVFILWGASIAWSLRSVNPQFNESKHIALILYHTFFVVLLIGILFVLPINPHMLRLLWMSVWLLMVAFAVSVLIVPKLRAIYHGVEYFEKGLKRMDADTMAANAGNWIPKQLKTEEIQQLVKILRKLGFKVHRSSARTPSSPNIFRRKSMDKYEDEYVPNVKKKKTNHLHTQSAMLHIDTLNIQQKHRMESMDSVVIHETSDDIDEIQHHASCHTVIGLPPPSSWDYSEEEEEHNVRQKKVRNLLPPPLPIHLKKQFDFERSTHQRAATIHSVPYPLPPVQAIPVCSVSPSDGMMEDDFDESFPKTLPSKQPNMIPLRSNSSASKVSDIIAKFNSIQVAECNSSSNQMAVNHFID